MTPALVRSACLFWVSKRILTESHRDTFRVLEILPSEDAAQTSAGGGITGPEGVEDEDADGANAAAAAEAAAAAGRKNLPKRLPWRR